MKSNFSAKLSIASALFLSTLLLTACGGDGGNPPPSTTDTNNQTGAGSGTSGGGTSGGGTSGGTGGSATTTYLFYTGSLIAVDPANPASPITVEAGQDIVGDNNMLGGLSTSVRTIRGGTYNSSTSAITDFHSHALIYAKIDGKLYRVSALKSGSLTPEQLSNENEADQLCIHVGGHIILDGSTVVSDLANLDDSQYVYALSGIDNVCGTGDDQWKMVRLGMSASDAPLAAKPPLAVFNDPNTGAISGWLVNDNGELKHCDADFANCGAPITTVASNADVRLTLNGTDHRHLMEIDNQLFVYDADTSTMSAPLFTIPAGTFMGPPATDGNTFYFDHEQSIYQLPADGNTQATVLAAETANITRVDVTSNKVIYQVGQEIKAVDKNGGAANSLISTSASNNMFFIVANNHVFYSISKFDTTPGNISNTVVSAGIIDENGVSKLQRPNAGWAGWIVPTSFSLNQPTSQFDDPSVLILAEGSGNGFGGATLKSFDPITLTDGVTLGTLPASDNVATIICSGFGDNVLCGAMIEITPAPLIPFQNDVFFLNSATANSLTRVTDTSDKSEVPTF